MVSRAYMEHAVDLARRARGVSSPNPPVGAVLVRDDRVIGEGSTQPPGHEHAEIMALRAAGDRAAGATLYVTLEPCSHWGRTPPCVDALIAARVATVHVAVLDPNPRVHGEGVHRLEQHGIRVTVGECAAEAAELVEAHATYITTGRPFVTLLLDAPEAVMDAHVAGTDAILTDAPGPRRSAQDVGDGLRPPLVLLLGHGAVSPGTDERTMVVTSYRSAAQETPPAPGGQILALPSSGDGVGLEPLLVELGRHEIASCLVIGSASLADALLSQSLVDKIVAGPDAVTPAGFLLRREVDRPAPHRVLYPTAWRQ